MTQRFDKDIHGLMPICFMDKHDDCSGPAFEYRLDESIGAQRMSACEKHFHELWAGEN